MSTQVLEYFTGTALVIRDQCLPSRQAIEVCCLLLPEAFRLFNGECKLLDKLFVVAVRRQVKTVEARVTARKP